MILFSISANDGTSFWEQGEGVTGVNSVHFMILMLNQHSADTV